MTKHESNNTLLIIAAAGLVGLIVYKWNRPKVVKVAAVKETIKEKSKGPVIATQQVVENVNSKILPEKDVSPPTEGPEPPTKEEKGSSYKSIGLAAAGYAAAAGGVYIIRKGVKIVQEGVPIAHY